MAALMTGSYRMQIEPRYINLTETCFVAPPEKIAAACDKNTIGVVGILGTTYSGHYEDLAGIDKAIGTSLFCLNIDINITAGMSYLHSIGLLRSDLKGGNVLLKSCAPTKADPRGSACKVSHFQARADAIVTFSVASFFAISPGPLDILTYSDRPRCHTKVRLTPGCMPCPTGASPHHCKAG